MASEKNLNAIFTDIANAIRTKKGTTAKIQPINMATEIVNLPSGGLRTTELSITQNGLYIPNTGIAYSKVSVNVPQTAEGSTMKAYLDAKKNCYYLFYKYAGTSIDGLISYSDTSNVTDMNSMFTDCDFLDSIPQLDTSNVTNMSYMFKGCPRLTTIPQLDTSNVRNMSYMFYQCLRLRTIPQFDTSSVTNMNNMFKECLALTKIPQFDVSSVTSMTYMFNGCSSLTTIPKIDVSSVKDLDGIFFKCTSLKSILMTGMKVRFDISDSTKFEKSDLVTILNNLAPVTSTTTLTMGATNLAKLTDEEKAIAINKGWTLA